MNIPIDPGVDALIFDLDGTLLDTLDVHHLAWRETLSSSGFEMSVDLFRHVTGKSSFAIVDYLNTEFGLGLDPDRTVMAKDQAYIRHAPRIHPFIPILDVVNAHQVTHKIGVTTNEGFGVAHIITRATGLAPLIQVLVTSDDVENPKPEPDVYIACAKALGVQPEKCQAFEDSSIGLDAARAARMVVTDVRPYL